jgi:Trk K+ transport system NAD-binding subunit
MERPVVLCGLGRVGWHILEFLREAGVPLAVVDTHVDPADPRLAGVRVVKGDCRTLANLEQAGVAAARGVIIVTSDDLVNVAAAMMARRVNPDCRIVVRMFNQGLITRLGGAIRNATALSVSALTAPLIALSALTGDSLGAFKLDSGQQQLAEVEVTDGSGLVGRRVTDLAGQFKLLVLAHLPTEGKPHLLHDVVGDAALAAGDRVVVCGRPDDLEALHESGRGHLLPGVRWASWLRRQWRTVLRTLLAVDLPVKVGGAALVLTLFVSTLLFRYGIGTDWAEGLYQTVTIMATGAELKGEGRDDWVKVFLSVLKIAGAVLVAACTAIFTNYLLRAKLGGALEARKIPDGGHIVVCGLGNVGYRCVEELVRLGRSVVAVDRVNDNPFAATARRMGVPVIIGDATVPEVLRQARTDTARALIAATSSELANLEVALLAREQNPTQRVVVRLSDPDFARAVRDAANVRHAVSIPALAAPAFAAALYGDRVHTLVSVAGRTLAVLELTVHPNDPCLHETSLVAAMIDYQFLPAAVAGQEPFAAQGIPKSYRLKTGDRLTVIIELPNLEQVLRRDPAAAEWDVVVESVPPTAAAALVPVVRTARGCTQAEAEALVREPGFTLASRKTRGAAEELLALVARERVVARLVKSV